MVEEIWAYGLRNPYRATIDRVTGDLYIGDVGLRDVEEINVIPDESTGGENFGWSVEEGSVIGELPGAIDPLFEYDHWDGASVTGGLVYRGSQIPELVGKYVFADFQGPRGVGKPIPPVARLFYGDVQTGEASEFLIAEGSQPLPTRIISIGEDADGELYLLSLDAVYPIRSATIEGDHNGDGQVTLADLALVAGQLGTVFDRNDVAAVVRNLGFIDSGAPVDSTALQENYMSASATVPEPSAACLAGMAAMLFLLFTGTRPSRSRAFHASGPSSEAA